MVVWTHPKSIVQNTPPLAHPPENPFNPLPLSSPSSPSTTGYNSHFSVRLYSPASPSSPLGTPSLYPFPLLDLDAVQLLIPNSPIATYNNTSETHLVSPIYSSPSHKFRQLEDWSQPLSYPAQPSSRAPSPNPIQHSSVVPIEKSPNILTNTRSPSTDFQYSRSISRELTELFGEVTVNNSDPPLGTVTPRTYQVDRKTTPRDNNNNPNLIRSREVTPRRPIQNISDIRSPSPIDPCPSPTPLINYTSSTVYSTPRLSISKVTNSSNSQPTPRDIPVLTLPDPQSIRLVEPDPPKPENQLSPPRSARRARLSLKLQEFPARRRSSAISISSSGHLPQYLRPETPLIQLMKPPSAIASLPTFLNMELARSPSKSVINAIPTPRGHRDSCTTDIGDPGRTRSTTSTTNNTDRLVSKISIPTPRLVRFDPSLPEETQNRATPRVIGLGATTNNYMDLNTLHVSISKALAQKSLIPLKYQSWDVYDPMFGDEVMSEFANSMPGTPATAITYTIDELDDDDIGIDDEEGSSQSDVNQVNYGTYINTAPAAPNVAIPPLLLPKR